jgi:hypothetical protein
MGIEDELRRIAPSRLREVNKDRSFLFDSHVGSHLLKRAPLLDLDSDRTNSDHYRNYQESKPKISSHTKIL